MAKAAFITTMRRYREIALDVSLIEVQKLMYFLQVVGEDMRLNYTKGHYGPYADNLRKALRSVEGHFITGFGDGSKSVRETEPIELLPGVSDELTGSWTVHPTLLPESNGSSGSVRASSQPMAWNS